MTFKEIALALLGEAGRPLSASEIVDMARTRGLLESEGRTPKQTMKAKLSTDIVQYGNRSVFMRTEPGVFALRAWSTTFPEYQSTRFVKARFDEDILVFPREELDKLIACPGYHQVGIPTDTLREICYAMRRSDAEEDFSVIQLVSAFVVYYQGAVLTYKRTKRLPESRLHGDQSVMFGGHITPEDLYSLFDPFDPNVGPVLRELDEELLLEDSPALQPRGLLYDETREVSTQHLGLVYGAKLASGEFAIGERGFLMSPCFVTFGDLRATRADYENWSQLLIDALDQIVED